MTTIPIKNNSSSPEHVFCVLLWLVAIFSPKSINSFYCIFIFLTQKSQINTQLLLHRCIPYTNKCKEYCSSQVLVRNFSQKQNHCLLGPPSSPATPLRAHSLMKFSGFFRVCTWPRMGYPYDWKKLVEIDPGQHLPLWLSYLTQRTNNTFLARLMQCLLR